MNEKELNVKIDLKKDSQPLYSEDGNMIFEEKVIFRKISRFLTGQPEDTILPITVFVDKNGKVLKELLPKQLWSEFGFAEEVAVAPIMSINKD